VAQLCWIGSEATIEQALIDLGYSKAQIKKTILTKKQRLKLIKYGSVIQIPDSLFNRFEANPKFDTTVKKPSILCSESSFLAVSKPSSVHSHPLHYYERDNLISFLREEEHYDFIKPFGKESYDRGLLYRLDYETSGLIILSRDESFLRSLRKGEKKADKKLYWAVVEGDYGEIGQLIHWLSTSGKKVYEDAQGREAHLSIEKASFNEEHRISLLRVELKEGLRHQIRAQLSLVGFPIVGDTLYGAEVSPLGFGLHCFQYEIDSHTFTDESFQLLNLFNL